MYPDLQIYTWTLRKSSFFFKAYLPAKPTEEHFFLTISEVMWWIFKCVFIHIIHNSSISKITFHQNDCIHMSRLPHVAWGLERFQLFWSSKIFFFFILFYCWCFYGILSCVGQNGRGRSIFCQTIAKSCFLFSFLKGVPSYWRLWFRVVCVKDNAKIAWLFSVFMFICHCSWSSCV